MAHRRSGNDRTSGAEPDDVVPRRIPNVAVAAVSVAAGFTVPLVVYAAAFSGAIHPLGPDLFGYIWQTRIVGLLPIADVGTRPGFPAFASTVSGMHAMTAAAAPLVLGPAMTVALGGAIAATVVLAFRLPAWALGPIAFSTAVWGGATHTATGYLANELSLVGIAVALFLLALPSSVGPWRTAGGLAAATAAGLAHPGLLPFYGAAGALWLVLSLPGAIRDRRAGGGWLDQGAVQFLVVVLAATAIVAAVIFGLMGQRLADVTNLTEGIRDFHARLSETAGIVGLWVSAVTVLAAAGVLVAWWTRRASSRDLIRIGLAWSAVAAAGALLTFVRASFPGHRALLMIVPLAVAAGLGIVGAGWVVVRGSFGAVGSGASRVPSGLRYGGAAAVVVIGCVLVALPGSHRLAALARLPARGDPARLVASYVATVRPGVPVVVLSSPITERAAPFTWRGRQNQVRAFVPSAQIVRTFVAVGVPDGHGGVARPRVALGGATADAVDESWLHAGPALASGAFVLMPREFTAHRVWVRIAADPSRLVTPDLAVLRGPDTAPAVPVPPARISGATATRDALAGLVVLALVGGGFALAAAWARRGTVLHAVAVAPAVGTVVVTLVALGVALVGADPAGPAGVAICVVVAVAGYGQAVRGWRARPASVLSSAA